MRRLRRIKILATLGPVSSDSAMIRRLFEAGADVFRINMSHTSHDKMRELVKTIRNVESSYGRPIGILVDLQGPKLRLGSFTDGAVQVFGPLAANLEDALKQFLDGITPGGYLAVMAYLDRIGDAEAAQIRPALARASRGRSVTFGWGPRFLHSTGQYHKGGPQVGSFLQITGAVQADLAVPGQAYTFGTLQAAQAAGDRQALAQRGRPLLHLHLTDRAAGLSRLLGAAVSLAEEV